MRLESMSVENFKALMNVTVPLSRFGCLIGENNAGKSSLLQALSLFFSGSRLTSASYFDVKKPIRITVAFTDISESDLDRLAGEHRTRVEQIVESGRLTLLRSYDLDGKSSLQYRVLTPKDVRFSSISVTELLSGQRAGQPLVHKVEEAFPELKGLLDTSMNQEAIRNRIRELADTIPPEEKELSDQPLPTGFDRSISPMLPDPIYIPAVKDLADDIKTTESAPFGRILSVLFGAIESKLPDAKRLFQELYTKLNRQVASDGELLDDRLDEVKAIEATLEKYLRESFSDVKVNLTIPPPELRSVFSSARIHVDDGVDGLVESKGDGLRRAMVLSILRAYVELRERFAADSASTTNPAVSESTDTAPRPHILLFEEPELFLHPRAQHTLFEALRYFSKEHHVIVTTHSPMFFNAETTKTFVKVQKTYDQTKAPRPFTRVHPIDLSDLNSKDQFQIICFENNNAALFAETVVLVEGDSDYLVLPHIAKTINPAWDASRSPVVFARISGKGNIRRYRAFFSEFAVRVPVVADLDLLVGGFDNIDPSKELQTTRNSLLARVDSLLERVEKDPSAKDAKRAQDSGELKALWKRVLECETGLKEGSRTLDDLNQAVEAFFAWQRKNDRLYALKHSEDAELLKLKRQLLDELRTLDVYVLERGAIDDYYPNEVQGQDKPARAQSFCRLLSTRESVLDCCSEVPVSEDGESTSVKEFELIFQQIFDARSSRAI